MHSDRGITLIALVITVIVIAIIAGTAFYAGTDSLEEAKRTAFITEVKMIKEKIALYDEKQGASMGKSATTVPEAQRKKILLSEGINITSLSSFRYFDKADFNAIDLTGIKNAYLIDFKTKQVLSANGVKVDGVYRYALHQLGANIYEPTYDENQLNEYLDFSLSSKQVRGAKPIVSIIDVKKPKHVAIISVRYKEKFAKEWQNIDVEERSFEVPGAGTYLVELTDSIGNVKIKETKVETPESIQMEEKIEQMKENMANRVHE